MNLWRALGQGVRGGPININITAFSLDSARLTFGGYSDSMQGEIAEPSEARIYQGNTPN